MGHWSCNEETLGETPNVDRRNQFVFQRELEVKESRLNSDRNKGVAWEDVTNTRSQDDAPITGTTRIEPAQTFPQETLALYSLDQ
jgi:hypothetical protein